MEQYWYILKNNKHLGPFYLNDLKKLKEQNKIGNDVVLWHPKWPAPELTMLVNLPTVPEKKVYRVSPNLRNLHRLQNHEANFNVLTKKNVDLTLFKSFLQIIENILSNPRLKMIVSLIIFNTFFYMMLHAPNVPPRPQSMSPTQYKDLQVFWDNKPADESQEFSVVTSKDFKTLWIAQKNEYEISTAHLSASNTTILSNLDFNKEWNIKSSDRLITLQFDPKEIPVAGFYNLQITWKKPNPWSLNEELITSNMKIKIGYQDDLQLKNLISSYHAPAMPILKNSPPDTEKNNVPSAIKQSAKRTHEDSANTLYQASKNEINASSSTELKEKYQTLSFIVTDVKNSWMEMKELSRPKLVKAMNTFQHRYAKSTGGFLTALVLSNEKEIKLLSTGKKSVNTDLIAHLTNLNEKAKLAGILSADLMSNYKTYAKNPKKEKSWDNKVSSLEKELSEKMNQL